MWCAKCDSDVATEVSADGQSLLCTTCGDEVRKVFAPSLHPDVQRARDLLSRLQGLRPSAADEPLADESIADEQIAAESHFEAALEGELLRAGDSDPLPAEPKRQFRIDPRHAPEELTRAHAPAPASHSRRAVQPQRKRRDDEAHASIAGPHFDVAELADRKHPGRGEAAWGQVLAYIGVAVLTVGTALVLWGYFGGPVEYAPTGWLVTTAGQMLLLLGVITLVSGGMQQTTHEVSSRVAHLDGRMIRIEQTAQELLRGPHFGRNATGNGQQSSLAAEEDSAE